MVRKLPLLLVLLSFWVQVVVAQQLKHVPVCGAVTPNTAQVYLRTSAPTAFDVLISTDSLNFSGAISVGGQTLALVDNSAKVNLTSLTADTHYYYKVQIGGLDASPVCHFQTFPLPTAVPTFTFAFGSCQGNRDTVGYEEPIFRQVLAAKPRFFLQCGDWGYPDTTDKAPNPNDVFPAVYQRVLNSYHARYSGLDIQEILQRVPFSYVWDDHDYVNNNTSETTSARSDSNPFYEEPFPPGTRDNAIRGYCEHFPHYPLPDSSRGIYHSIRFGNVEVFMCDDRASRSPNFNALTYNGSVYTYAEPAGHSILGVDQMNWLLDGLKNSTAQWKFLVTGVAFNKGYRKLIDAVSGNSVLQNLTLPGLGTGTAALAAGVDTWSAFRADQDRVTDWCALHNIKNVVVLSSDSHTAAIDDGTNAGLPELMSGNLHKNNSRIAQLMSQAASIPLINADLNIWNAGGQGLGNSNFEYTFGKLDVFGNDSLRMSIVDVNGTTVASLTLCDGGQPCRVSGVAPKLVGDAFAVYPSPAQTELTVAINLKDRIGHVEEVFVTDLLGKRLMSYTGDEFFGSSNLQKLDVSQLPKGIYYFAIKSTNGLFAKSFVKE